MRRALLSGVVAAALVAAASRTDTWSRLEERAQAVVARWRGPLPWPDDVVVVAIDNATLERHGWPVPRDALARLVELASKSGAKAVGIDAYLIEPSNNDEALAEAGRNWPHLVLGADCIPTSVRPKTLECQRITVPAGPLASAATLAHLHARASASGLVRSFFSTAATPKGSLHALALATFEAGGGEPPEPLPIELTPHWRDTPPSISLDEVLDEATRSGTDRPPPSLSKLFANKWVLVGQTVAGAGDLRPLFPGDVRPLIELHAALLADLAEGRQLRAVPPAAALALTFIVGLLAAVLTSRLRPPPALAAVTLLLLALAGAAALAQHGDWLFAPLAPLASVTLAFAAAATARASLHDPERERLRTALIGALDPRLLDRVLDEPNRFLALTGARKRLSVLFSDIRGYTGLSNDRPAAAVLAVLREYVEVMTRLVTTAEGRVERLTGDGILAVFGDPLPLPNHAERAVEVALKMQEEISRLSRKWEAEHRSPVAIRIGIATGDVFVGDVSPTREKVEYTVLGPTVNLAARLEGRAPPGGVLVSAQTHGDCHDRFELQSVGALALKGFQDVHAAYLAVGPRLSADPERAAPRIRAHAEVTVRSAKGEHAGTVTDVSAGGLYVASAHKPMVGDSVEIVFGTGGILAGPATVTVRGEVRHLREDGFGIEVQRAASEDAAAVRHFIALYLGPEALLAQVHSSSDGYQVDLGQLRGT
jgi:adenylate cyclase